MNTENLNPNEGSNKYSLQFKKLVVHILSPSEMNQEITISLGSCYCSIEGDEITIEAVHPIIENEG